jgi:hypothetical protein
VYKFFVGEAQRSPNKHWRGSAAKLLATMKSQQAVAKHFCWKARQSFDVPFFWFQRGPSGLHIASPYEPSLQWLRRCSFVSSWT